MNQRRSISSPDPFRRIRAELDRWRRHRVPGDRIPARLWTAAVDLAREHGVSRASSALRVDYYALKDRLGVGRSSSRPAVSSSRADVHGGGFVEIPLEIRQPVSMPECVVVLEDTRGTRLRVELRGGAASADGIDALTRSLWRGAERGRES